MSGKINKAGYNPQKSEQPPNPIRYTFPWGPAQPPTAVYLPRVKIVLGVVSLHNRLKRVARVYKQKGFICKSKQKISGSRIDMSF